MFNQKKNWSNGEIKRKSERKIKLTKIIHKWKYDIFFFVE